MTERISEAIDILLDALNNGTLAKGSCITCVVGQLVAHGMAAKIFKIKYDEGNVSFYCTKNNEAWGVAFGSGVVDKDMLRREDVQDCINATKFSLHELMEFDRIFEFNTIIHFKDYHLNDPKEIRKDLLYGLDAVIKVMQTFDNQPDSVQEIFINKANMVPVY